jgi:hypothetical protein
MLNDFYVGFNETIDTLDKIELLHGMKEAKCAARASIAEHVRAGCKTLSEYGALCGATDWLATAEGIRERVEALINQ